jgi:REP element-mobilizing transposase RayT
LCRRQRQETLILNSPMNSDEGNNASLSTNLKPRTFFLPRLSREFYQGDAAVHWTLTVFDRKTGWLNDSFHFQFRELMFHVAAREWLFCPAYCLMSDHIHLIWLGLRQKTDQRNGMSFLRTYLKPLLAPYKLQSQPHDHVLSEDERKRNAFAKICFYILANPIRAGLIKETNPWPYRGAILPGYPKTDPIDADFWPLFWKLYQQQLEPDAGKRKLPLRR